MQCSLDRQNINYKQLNHVKFNYQNVQACSLQSRAQKFSNGREINSASNQTNNSARKANKVNQVRARKNVFHLHTT